MSTGPLSQMGAPPHFGEGIRVSSADYHSAQGSLRMVMAMNAERNRAEVYTTYTPTPAANDALDAMMLDPDFPLPVDEQGKPYVTPELAHRYLKKRRGEGLPGGPNASAWEARYATGGRVVTAVEKHLQGLPPPKDVCQELLDMCDEALAYDPLRDGTGIADAGKIARPDKEGDTNWFHTDFARWLAVTTEFCGGLLLMMTLILGVPMGLTGFPEQGFQAYLPAACFLITGLFSSLIARFLMNRQPWEP